MQLHYSYRTAQHIFWHYSKSHYLLNSANVGITEVVSRGSETVETPSSVITLSAAMGVAVNSETPQKRCWHSLTRVGRNMFWRKKETKKTLLLKWNQKQTEKCKQSNLLVSLSRANVFFFNNYFSPHLIPIRIMM